MFDLTLGKLLRKIFLSKKKKKKENAEKSLKRKRITPKQALQVPLVHGTKVVSWWWTIGVARFASISPRFISNFRELAPAWLSRPRKLKETEEEKGWRFEGEKRRRGVAPPKVG